MKEVSLHIWRATKPFYSFWLETEALNRKRSSFLEGHAAMSCDVLAQSHIHSHSDAGVLKIQLPIPVLDLEPEAHTVWRFIIFLQT